MADQTKSGRQVVTEKVLGHRRVPSARYLVTVGAFLVIGALVIIPMIFYLWGSVWSEAPGLGGHFTLSAYSRLAGSGALAEPLYNTIIIGVVGTVLALAITVAVLVFTIKFDIPGSHYIELVVILQYLIPGFIMSLAWRYYAGETGAVNDILMALPFINSPVVNVESVWGIALVGALHYTGLVYLISSAAIKAVPKDLEETAMNANASRLETLYRVTIPLAIPSLAISAVLVATRLSQSFSIPLILGLPNRVFVLSTSMYLTIQTFPPDFALGSAIGLLLLVGTMVGLYVQQRITGARDKYQTVGTRGSTDETLIFEMGRMKWVVSGIFYLFIFVFYIAPYIVIFLSSFQAQFVGLELHRATWTLANYESFLVGTRAPSFWSAFQNSIVIAVGGAFVGMLLCVVASYIIVKSDPVSGRIMDYLTLAPIGMPSIVYATAFLWLFVTYNPFGLYGTIWVITLALIGKFLVYGTRAANSAFRSISDAMEEAAQVSGAGFISTFRRINIPLIKDGFIAGYTVLVIDMFKVLTIPLLLGGFGNQVLPTLIWSTISSAKFAAAAALTVIMTVIIAGGYLLIVRITGTSVKAL